MGRRKRRDFSPADKVAILKRHLLDGLPVSEVCDEFDIRPNQFCESLGLVCALLLDREFFGELCGRRLVASERSAD